jgi:NADH-quinone oxidoreductase subunit B
LGTVNYKQAAILKKIYQQMADPKYVIAVGACATCGGFYDNYAVVQGIDEVIPVDVYVPGCPPRPEQILLAVIKLQEKLEQGARGKEVQDKLRARVEILESDKHPEFQGTFIK